MTNVVVKYLFNILMQTLNRTMLLKERKTILKRRFLDIEGIFLL